MVGVAGGEDSPGLLIALLPKDWPLTVVADETIERRNGRRIQAKGRYRDAALDEGYGGQVLRPQMDQPDAAGAVAVEYPAVGVAVLNDPGPVGTGEYGGEAAP